MRKIEGLVIHRGEITSDNREYHYLVQQDGSVIQLNPDSVKAPHAKDFNATTLGICVFGDFAPAEHSRNNKPTAEQLTALMKLCVDLRSKYGYLWIKGHSELGPQSTAFPEKLTREHACPGENLDLDALRLGVAALDHEEAMGDH